MAGVTGTATASVAMLVDGQPDTGIDPLDRGLNYGDGLFETLAVRNGVPCLWERHVDRLLAGCRRLSLTAPDRTLLEREAESLCAGSPDAVLKIVLTRGVGPRGYAAGQPRSTTRILSCGPTPAHVERWRNEGVRLTYCKTRLGINPALAGIKHLNRLEQVLAATELSELSADEGLMRDLDGIVVEGTCTNIFVDIDGRLITPPIDRCGVAGVVRQLVLDRATSLHQPLEVRPIRPADLAGRGERIFVTNALIGVAPARSLDDRPYPAGDPLPAALAVADAEAFRR